MNVTDVIMLTLDELTYTLPQELIAQRPAGQRDACKMLVYDRATKQRTHLKFFDLPALLTEKDVLVLNTTKVWKARLWGRRLSGGKVEILVLDKVSPNRYEILLQPSGRIKDGEYITLGEGPVPVQARIHKEQNSIFMGIDDDIFCAIRQQAGAAVPLPPYIKRPAEAEDDQVYQTIYAAEEGSVAAPTAGFHFTEELLAVLIQKGVQIVKLTMHIGYGTFRLIASQDVKAHQMLPEYSVISEETADILNRCISEGRRLIAVGTSATRALESAYSLELKKIVAFNGYSELFICPGYRFNAVDALITNFHLPKTSLLALAYAFAGKETVLSLYQEAIDKQYRFYSYGDAMFLI